VAGLRAIVSNLEAAAAIYAAISREATLTATSRFSHLASRLSSSRPPIKHG